MLKVKILATWKYTVCSNLFMPHSCIFSCSFLLFYRETPPLAFRFHLFFCHVWHVEICLKCTVVIQGWCSDLFLLFLQVKKKVSHLITSHEYVTLAGSIISLQQIWFVKGTLTTPLHYGEIAGFGKWDCWIITEVKTLQCISSGQSTKKKNWKMKGLNPWHHNAGWWSYSEFALCRASCFFAYCEGLETTLNHSWSIQFPYGLYDVKWRGGWWFRGVTQSQYVHLSMQCY